MTTAGIPAYMSDLLMVAYPAEPTHRWSPAKGTWFYSSTPPSAAHRFLQRIVLGIQWEKL